jgi:TOBE domain
VILGIRPENLEIATFSRKEGKAASVGFPAIVDIVEPMGAETNLYLQTCVRYPDLSRRGSD